MTAEERLKSGEVICLEDQWMVYLSYERGKYITWGIQYSVLHRVLEIGGTPDYEVEEHDTLADALLKVTLPDHEWLKCVPGH